LGLSAKQTIFLEIFNFLFLPLKNDDVNLHPYGTGWKFPFGTQMNADSQDFQYKELIE
jgi:hypothetical protein